MTHTLTILLLLSALAGCNGTVQQTKEVAKQDTSTPVFTFSSDTTYFGKVTPCPIDTLKGVLIWNNREHGDSWDSAYWIGKCGPIGMGLEKFIFIPGQNKDGYQSGSFYNRDFKRIPSADVYAMIIMREGNPNKTYRWGSPLQQ